jgi:hypothetical protein
MAWTPIDPSRPVWRPPVPYALNEAGSDNLPIGTLEPIVRQGFDDWTRVSSCSTSLTTRYNGRTAARANASGADGQSIVSWVESGWRHGSGAIGVTSPKWSRNITEADMEMNGVNYTWIEGAGSGNRVNTYSIVAHEAGHYFGLGHSSDARAIMYYAYSGGVGAINADDSTGICTLYPGSGAPPPDCTTAGCPAGQRCDSATGMCVTVTGDGGVCSPCRTRTDCSAGYCLGYPDGGSYCGRTCTSGAQCDRAAGEVCADLGGIGQCIRLVGGSPSCAGASTPSGCSSDSDCGATERCNTTTRACEPRPTTGAPLGSPCTAGTDCQSGRCFGGTCTQTCNWLNVGSCPSGFYCDGDATGTCGEGLCAAGAAGAAALGGACARDTDCASLYCDAGRCTAPCQPDGATGCPAGYACQVGTRPTCGACKVTGTAGDRCEMDLDCTSGICASVDGRRFCTTTCDSARPCPTGFTCTESGAISLCVPDAGGLGEDCAGNPDCLSGICATEGADTYCTRLCTDALPCPASFECVSTADGMFRICRPSGGSATPGSSDRGGCGCVAAGQDGAAGTTGATLAGLAAAALALAARGRRRGRARAGAR